MKIYKKNDTAFVEHWDKVFQKEVANWDEFINRKGLFQLLSEEIKDWEIISFDKNLAFDAPIGQQEVWASGVTYQRSKVARMEESKEAGGATFYDKVYEADRPELFFKATPNRVVGTQEEVYIRRDSKWNVPEPELTLFISSEGTIEGYTIGNDVSSRDIEGENPLYLPQAKTYERCAALGPCILVLEKPISLTTTITLEILRRGKSVFEESIRLNRMKRKLEDLVEYLFRECDFPSGCFLMTGTGIIPDDNFTLRIKDEVRISTEGIGTLVNMIGIKNH
ncbi:MAG: fumarylacetoacetate hydrolase family protein [Bacteroidota bacterium]